MFLSRHCGVMDRRPDPGLARLRRYALAVWCWRARSRIACSPTKSAKPQWASRCRSDSGRAERPAGTKERLHAKGAVWKEYLFAIFPENRRYIIFYNFDTRNPAPMIGSVLTPIPDPVQALVARAKSVASTRTV